MHTADRIRFLTDNFSYLQGLKTIPIGLAVIAIAWFENVSVGPGKDLGPPLLILTAALLAYELISRYYRSKFGQIRKSIRQRLPEIAMGILAVAASYLAFWFDPQIDWLGSPLGVTVAILLGVDYLRTSRKVIGRYHGYTPVFAGILFLLSILPALGFKQWWLAIHIQSQTLAILLVLGVLIVVMGILGHLTLLKLLRESEVARESGI